MYRKATELSNKGNQIVVNCSLFVHLLYSFRFSFFGDNEAYDRKNEWLNWINGKSIEKQLNVVNNQVAKIHRSDQENSINFYVLQLVIILSAIFQ